MTKLLVTLFLLLFVLSAAQAGPGLMVTLPDPGTYSYWRQSQDGTVPDPPVTVSQKPVVTLTADVTTGDHVFVLSARTGLIASRTISLGLDGLPIPVKFSPVDFQSAAPTFISAAPSETPPAEEAASGMGALLTGLVSLLLAAGALWFLIHLVRTRGQPRLRLARQAAIDTPAPKTLEPENVEATVIYTPAKRTLEKVPDEVIPPPLDQVPRVERGLGITLPGTEVLVGVQGLVAGSTFSLADGDVIVGRDGESGIVLAENTVSRRHARLFRDASGQFTLTDLGSANGVFVNGMRVQRAILNSGDEIKIGDNYFRFQAAKET